MTSADERGGAERRDVREWLGTALAEMAPPRAPVDAVLRRGRHIRARRRAAVVAALAAAAVVAVLAPGLLRGNSAPAPVAPVVRPRVTVARMGPAAPGGLIAKGTVNGRSWTIVLTGRGSDICVNASSVAGLGCGIEWLQLGGPVSFSSAASGDRYAVVGTVGNAVRRVGIALSDGTVLRLDPVRWGPARWIGVELPRGLSVARLTAYSRHGELGYAIPFTDPLDGLPILVSWLTPGEPVPGRVTRLVGVGRNGAARWSIVVHAGPWGWCAVPDVPGSGGTTGCWPGLPRRYGGITGSGGPISRPWWIVGAVHSSVSYLAMSLKNGGTVRIPVVNVAGERLYAVAIFRPSLIAGWGAYDAHGRRLYGGSGAPT